MTVLRLTAPSLTSITVLGYREVTADQTSLSPCVDSGVCLLQVSTEEVSTLALLARSIKGFVGGSWGKMWSSLEPVRSYSLLHLAYRAQCAAQLLLNIVRCNVHCALQCRFEDEAERKGG